MPRSATNLHLPGVAYRPLHNAPRPDIDLCCIYQAGDTSPVLARLLASMRSVAPTVAAAPGPVALSSPAKAGGRPGPAQAPAESGQARAIEAS